MLGNRLLFTGTVNEDAERILIFHMREVCNVKLLSALQTMLQDLHISRELNSSFRDFCAGNPSTEDFSIDDSYRVLSSAKAWHLNLLDTEFTPPLAVAQRCERFIEFYKTQHKGRRLTWLWQLCRGEVLANYVHLNSKPYQFRLSAYQMAILFLFNDADEVSYEDMEISTRLVRSILVPCIESLVKLKVLSVYPPKRKPAEASFYSLNNEFQSRKIKVSLHITSKTERLLEAEDTHRAISEERRLIIKVSLTPCFLPCSSNSSTLLYSQWSIRKKPKTSQLTLDALKQCTAVRIMKLRKQMNCRELALELTQQLRSRFTPTTSDLKRCIEGLVETEFLTRLDEECLGYIA
jgi:cullin 1